MVEPFGIFILVLSFINIKRTKELFLLLLAMSFFTGTSALNIGNFSLQPSYVVLVFLMFNLLYRKFFKVVLPNKWLFSFMFFVVLSVAMPIFLENKEIVLSVDDKWELLNLKSSNITQLMYIFTSFIVYIISKFLIRNQIVKIEDIEKLIKIVTIIIACLSFYQLIAYMHKLPYDIIFRNSVHKNIQPYGKFIRVYGVSAEPSMHAINTLFLLSFNILIKNKSWIIVSLIFISGLLSTSTTFAFGVILLGIYIVLKYLLSKPSKKEFYNKFMMMWIIFGLMFFLFLIMAIKFPILKMFYSTEIIEKLQGNNLSGSIRKETMLKHLIIAFKYPIFGIGFGSVRTKDLLTTWLSEIGFIGFGCFLIYLYRLRKVKEYYLYVPLFVCFLLELISVPEPYYLYLWIFMGIIEEKMIEKKKYEKNTYINYSKIGTL